MAIRHSKGLMNSAWSLYKKCKNFPVCFSTTTVCPMLQLVFPKLGPGYHPTWPTMSSPSSSQGSKGLCKELPLRIDLSNHLEANPNSELPQWKESAGSESDLVLFSVSMQKYQADRLISPDYTINLHSLAKELRGVPSEQSPRWSPAELWSRFGQNASLLLQKKSSLLCFHMQRVDAMCSSTSLIILSNWIYK